MTSAVVETCSVSTVPQSKAGLFVDAFKIRTCHEQYNAMSYENYVLFSEDFQLLKMIFFLPLELQYSESFNILCT